MPSTRRLVCDAPAPVPVTCGCCTQMARLVSQRVSADLARRGFLAGAAASLASLGLPDLAAAQATQTPADPPGPVLFRNVRLFDGVALSLADGKQVLVMGNRIAAIDAANTPPPDGARVIDGRGSTLMPGLIDAHWHTLIASLPFVTLLTADVGYVYLAAAAEAERTLMRGFTTVRDLGGPSFALKRAVDDGTIVGPRIYPCGAMISQTGGHGDFRFRYEFPRTEQNLSYSEMLGNSAIADGPDQVLRRVREQLALGASQIKLAGGGGISSLYDPIDTLQFNPEEIRAAVGAAADWGTYVTVHIYTPDGIARYVDAGVRCIEHGQLADEESVRKLVDQDVWWCLQPFLAGGGQDRPQTPDQKQKAQMVYAGTDTAYRLAIKHGAKVAWGTDILFAPGSTNMQSARLTAMTRWYTPAQALRSATSDNGRLLMLSGPRNPYDGKLGVIEKGALADLLVVAGDPTHDLSLFDDPDTNLNVIMKDGVLHKNTLPQ